MVMQMAKKNNQYWAERMAQRRFDIEEKSMKRRLRMLYKKAGKEIQGKAELMQLEVLALGEDVTVTQLLRLERYKGLINDIGVEFNDLGKSELELMNVKLSDTFKQIYIDTSKGYDKTVKISWTIQNQKMLEQVIREPWSGKHFSSRIHKNKKELMKRLEKGITNSVVKGVSKDVLVKEIMDKMGTGFNDADRLVRTELMNVINQGQKSVHMARGYKRYTLSPFHDERTGDICNDLDTTIEYDYETCITGVNFPPLHPNCRTIDRPIISSRED